jgi:hypothetical protein
MVWLGMNAQGPLIGEQGWNRKKFSHNWVGDAGLLLVDTKLRRKIMLKTKEDMVFGGRVATGLHLCKM